MGLSKKRETIDELIRKVKNSLFQQLYPENYVLKCPNCDTDLEPYRVEFIKDGKTVYIENLREEDFSINEEKRGYTLKIAVSLNDNSTYEIKAHYRCPTCTEEFTEIYSPYNPLEKITLLLNNNYNKYKNKYHQQRKPKQKKLFDNL